ncbi:MAG TPA: DUF308 domain-containing protein [Bradyrhizobium sp.]|jgi:hypothetical protein
MVVFLLVAGIGLLLVGLAAIGFGIPVKEFSFGNTLIFAGSVAACTGLVMLGLSMVVRELKTIARGLVGNPPQARTGAKPSGGMSAKQVAENVGPMFNLDQPGPERPREAESAALPSGPAPPPAPWLEEATARDRVRHDAPPAPLPEPAPGARPRRNLLFSASSRKERERAEERMADSAAADLRGSPIAPQPPRPAETPPGPLQDAWPPPERSRIADALPQRRSSHAPSTFTEPGAGPPTMEPPPPAAPDEVLPPVTVLKSGVVDGMAYSLYSDGSIEAQMPEGMMRFASIDELRAHLDQRS